MRNERGFILILTLMFMVTLTLIVMGFLFMTMHETKSTGAGGDDMKLLYLADAGIDRAYRALRDDYAAPPQTGAATLRGGDTSNCVSINNQTNLYYIDAGYATINTTYNGNPVTGEQAIIRTFDSNYTNTRIISVFPYVEAGRATGGQGATIQFSYTTDGTNYTVITNQALPSNTALVTYPNPGIAIAGLTWAQITSPNFRLRAIRTAGNRDVRVGSMYLRVTYGIDALTNESWNNASYTGLFPITLGSGTIQSAVITDEASKVHLNYASQALIEKLLTNIGGIATPAAKAAAIVTYRTTGPNFFDSVEELQRVPGITADDYTAAKNYFTVYSYVNQNCYNSHVVGSAAVSRAPIDINTAPFWVLKAVFDPLPLGTGTPPDSTTLANAIISQRTSSPFVGFYSSSSASNTYFYNFVQNLSSATFSAAEKQNIIDNSDASLLAPVSGFTNATQTTEFCYAGAAFNIDALARIGTRNFRVKTVRDSSGGSTFTNYVTDTSSVGWRAENFE